MASSMPALCCMNFEAQAVHDVESLLLVPVVGVGQSAVGHHAVDVEGHELDAGSALAGIHQITRAVNRSCMLRAPTRVTVAGGDEGGR